MLSHLLHPTPRLFRWSAATTLAALLAAASCSDLLTDAPLHPSGQPAATLASSASITYSDFTSPAGLTLEGTAAIATGAPVLRLTPAAHDRTGAAWLARQQPVSGGFSTTFRFRMHGGDGGDGLAFVIQNHSAQAYFPPTESCGSCLGYDGMPHSVAIEFDTYRDGDVTGRGNANHVAVHSNGAGPNSYEATALRGAAVPAFDLNDGASHAARIDYQPGSPGTLKVYLQNPATGAFDPVLSVDFDLVSIGLNGGAAWVGFTAATGAAVQDQDIESWSFTPSSAAYPFAVLVTSPTPVAGVLVTATDVETGEALYRPTGPDGKAHFDLLDGSYIFTARRVAVTDPHDLQVWPVAGETMPVSGPEMGAFAGAVYVDGGSRVLDPDNFNAAYRSPLVLDAPAFARLNGQIELRLTRTATIACTMLDEDGGPMEESGMQLFGTLPYTNTHDLPPIPRSFTGNRNLPRGLGYGIANVNDDGSCALPGAPEGTTVLESSPVLMLDGPMVFRTAVTVSASEADDGDAVETTMGPQPMLAFTNYSTDEPWGDARGGNDIGGLVTYGWKGGTGNTFVVASGFRGLGTYTLELFASDPATSDPKQSDPVAQVAAVCSAKRCRAVPRAPKPPAGSTATGVSTFGHGVWQGTLVWQVPLPHDPSTVWLRITASGRSGQGDRTVVLKAVRQAGTGNSFLIMAGS